MVAAKERDWGKAGMGKTGTFTFHLEFDFLK